MATLSCHSNQSSEAIGTKKTVLLLPTSYRCYIKSGKKMASQLQWRCRWKMLPDDDDGRTDDGCLAILSADLYKPLAQVS